MNGALRLSTVDITLKGLKKSKRELHRLLKALPDEDAYATPYSVIADGINAIDELIKEIKPSLKDAKEHRKQYPDQFPNRARKWCVINDSRRKPSAGSEETASPDAETA
jgi:hypothetical protein